MVAEGSGSETEGGGSARPSVDSEDVNWSR